MGMMISRFLGSMFMHLNVEQKIKKALVMMKYAINHPDNFTNRNNSPPFVIGLMTCIISFIIELNCMVILITLPNTMEVINKYVSLISIVNLPTIYHKSINADHKLVSCDKIDLKVTRFRSKDNIWSTMTRLEKFEILKFNPSL